MAIRAPDGANKKSMMVMNIAMTEDGVDDDDDDSVSNKEGVRQ